jgi:hypothetical protein
MLYKEKLILEFTNLILEQVEIYKKSLDSRGRKNKFTYSNIINIFLTRLETNLTWERLADIYKISRSHINSIFCKWTNNNVFKNAYNKFLKKYKIFINNNEAYIDTTTILNKYGYVNTTGFNSYESKKHKCNKLSIISSSNNIPLGIKIGPGNIHDINLLIDTLPKKINFKILYADKSYNSIKLKQKLLINKKVKLIYPYKKNQIDINTIEDKSGLKNRARIEHVNNFIKQNKALNYRYEKDILNFESLVYLGCLKLGLQIIIRDFYKF